LLGSKQLTRKVAVEKLYSLADVFGVADNWGIVVKGTKIDFEYFTFVGMRTVDYAILVAKI
jgi:hypothetical protein